jgi:Ca2+-transporting ATPase
VLALEAGDLVAADARLLASTAFSCVESALTGESDAVDKDAGAACTCETPLADRLNMVFMGTSVATGTARAVVTATGMGTELGRIAQLIEAGEEETPLQKKLDAFGRVLIWATLGIVALLFLLGYLRGSEPFELFLGAVSLAVAAVPEGLPAVVTVALALGVSRMARRRALVRSLPAVETLGSTTVICTDKTGTLTAGEMTVRVLYAAGQAFEVTGEGYAPDGEVLAGGRAPDARQREVLLELASVLLGCNNARLAEKDGTWSAVGDPTEAAMLAAGAKAGGDQDGFDAAMPRVHEIPFDSDRKLSTVVRRMPDKSARALVNGAPDVLLGRCTHILAPEGVRPMTDGDRRSIAAQNTSMAGQALRVLGSARRDLDDADLSGALARDCAVPASRPSGPSLDAGNPIEQGLTFIGLCGMYDPPRPEAGEAVARCRAAGIRVVMITGDHPHTAAAIARELGISVDGQVVSGAELSAMSDGELARRVTGIDVYARVTAEHKLRVIRAWKEGGAVVAMTGDGVNDAPALKRADVGVAMGIKGTEATKEAAEIVLADDNFQSIERAVEEGRTIYDNLRKAILFILPTNGAEGLVMLVAVAFGLVLPLTPVQILWVNMVTAVTLAVALAFEPAEADVMARPPRRPDAAILDGYFLWRIFFVSVLIGGATILVFIQARKSGLSLDLARTLAVNTLVLGQLFYLFNSRHLRSSSLRRDTLLANRVAWGAAVVLLWLQITYVYAPFMHTLFGSASLSPLLWAIPVGIGLIMFLLVELEKKLVARNLGDGR